MFRTLRFYHSFFKFLSTPSARRATVFPVQEYHKTDISIHALREEGDAKLWAGHVLYRISIHALREEGDLKSLSEGAMTGAISIHALREEGDPAGRLPWIATADFYPRPPRGGRQLHSCLNRMPQTISIHALREEGDPRPNSSPLAWRAFLSTPSARRATTYCFRNFSPDSHFYPRPPRGGRRCYKPLIRLYNPISIHALREEGDVCRVWILDSHL